MMMLRYESCPKQYIGTTNFKDDKIVIILFYV